MSSKKRKSGGSSDLETVRQGTSVRVLYDDIGWFHGDVKEVMEEGGEGKTTKCIVAFEDGETADADFPSSDAQVCFFLLRMFVAPTSFQSAAHRVVFVFVLHDTRACVRMTRVCMRQILMAPSVLKEAIKDTGQGRVAEALAAVLKKKRLIHTNKHTESYASV